MSIDPDLTLDELRSALIPLITAHAAFDGWGDKAIAAAAGELGVPADRAGLCFPGGASDILDAYLDHADQVMLAALDARGLDNLRFRDRITLAIRVRLEQAALTKEATRRAVAMLALPALTTVSARGLWRTVDHMWHAAGDTSTDFNFYTKRGTLAVVYGSTLLFWLRDESPDHEETWAFLDRRIDNVMGIEKLKAKWRERRSGRPSVTEALSRLRYGRSRA